MFSLYIDRLERFLASSMEGWTYRERDSVRIAGLCLPCLLYADDIVLIARSRDRMMCLLSALSAFCEGAGLTVNLAKTSWLLGGWVSR